MLVLTVKQGRKVFIGDIEITILQRSGKRTKIGVEAPIEVRIRRAETIDIPPPSVEAQDLLTV